MSDSPVVAYAPIPPMPETSDYIEPPAAGYTDKLIQARLAGHGWEDVDRFINRGTDAALTEGYAQREIDDYLGLADPQFRMAADARNRLSSDEQFAASLKSSTSPLAITPLEQPSADRMQGYASWVEPPPAVMPMDDKPLEPSGIDLHDEHMRNSYARSLFDDAARSPRDFAERYAGGLAAASDIDPGSAIRAAGELASTLPSDRDFTDQAIAIAASGGLSLSPEIVRTVRNNLIDHWADTGADLMDVYKQVETDPGFAAQLTTEKKPAPSMLEQFAAAEMAEVERSQDIGGWITDRLKDWYSWRMSQPDATQEGWDKHVEEAQEFLKTGKLSEDALDTALGFVGGSIENVGAKFGEAIGLLKPAEPMVKLLDPAATGGIAGEIPFTKSLEPPKPADRVPVSRETPEGATPTSPLDFVPEASPAEKMQAIARDWTEQHPETLADLRVRNGGELPKETDPNFFEKLAAGQDPATVELAQAHDTTTGVWGYIKTLAGDIWKDESGGLNIVRTPEQQAQRASYTDARDFMRPLIIQQRSQGEQVVSHFYDQADHWKTVAGKTENLFKLLEPHMKEFTDELAKGINGNPMNTMVGNMIQYVEGRSMGAAMRHDSQLTPVADGIRYINQTVRDMLEDGFRRGIINYNSYFDDYFRHMWKDPNKASRAFEEFQSRVGKLGSSSGLMQRSLPTFEDGLKMGLEPAIANPLELTLFDAAQKIKYLKSAEILEVARATRNPLTGDKYVNWRVGPQGNEVPLGSHRTTKGIPNDPQGRDLQAYADPGLANTWNDWLSKGFHERPGATSSFYDKMLYTFNTMSGISLALPSFHAMTEIMEAWTGGISHALAAASSGRVLEAGKELSLSIPPVSTVRGVAGGASILKEYNSRFITNPALQALVDAGARFGPRQEIYKMGAATPYSVAIRRGQLISEWRDEITGVFGNAKEPIDYRIAHAPFRAFGVAAHETGRLLNAVSAPLFDYAIPRLKAYNNVRQMDLYLRSNPLATPEQIAKRASQIVRNTDERLGEMNMDSVFWKKGVKQTAQLGMISLGWVYGWARLLTSAAGLNIEKMAFEANPVAVRSLVGFTMAYAMESAAYQYLKTGQLPFTTDTPIHDLLAPRTGGKDQYGAPERALLPSQAKELVDFYKIGAYAAHDPMLGLHQLHEYARGKGKVPVQLLMGLATGVDAIGNDIGHTAGGWTGFIEDAFKPIFLSALDDRKKGTEISPMETMMGLHPMTKAAQNPQAFYEGLHKQDRRLYKQQINRAKHENKIYINPREIPVDPEAGPSSSHGPSSAQHKAFSDFMKSRGH